MPLAFRALPALAEALRALRESPAPLVLRAPKARPGHRVSRARLESRVSQAPLALPAQ